MQLSLDRPISDAHQPHSDPRWLPLLRYHGMALAEQLVGIREVDDQVWQVSFLEYDLGYFDRDQDRVEPGPNPFAPHTV
jgi:hypothetical protein